MEHKKYYEKLDILRLLSCICVLLYHLNILKGGYLAVCIFFVLTAYLSCVSAFRKEKFSLKDYYINRLLHIYLPLLIVVFITIFVISFIPSINWFNLKPETTSVIFGYNNFWQLSANLDYFARHIDSPFMHFWYIGIQIQFDLVFPFIFILLKKIGDKVKIVPCIISAFLALISACYFFKASLDSNIMVAYYNTLTRAFSLLFGLSLGFIHNYYESKVIKAKPFSTIIFIAYLLIAIGLMLFVDAQSKYFALSMILITLIAGRMISYSTVTNDELNSFNKIIKSLASISYEVYLVQYPLIFLAQEININAKIKMVCMILMLVLLSYIIHIGTDFKKRNIFKYGLYILLLGLTLCGVYKYVASKDHTQEMKELEEQLSQNEKLMLEKQEEYTLKQQQEKEAWENELSNLSKDEGAIEGIVSNLPIVGVGDSVMLGAVPSLYKQFPNGYFDAKLSRTAWVVNGILLDLKNKNALGEPIVIGLGANGDCPESCKEKIIKTVGNRKIYWINATNNKAVHVNEKINAFAKKHENVYVIDWESISKNHSEYFGPDGIHLTNEGIKAYTKAIYDAIYQDYLDEYNKKKDELIKKHDEELKTKIVFYGNDLLLNAFSSIKDSFKDAKFNINSHYNFDSLYSKLKEDKQKGLLNYNVVLAFDNTLKLNKNNYQKIIELLDDNKVYIISLNKEVIDIKNKNVTIIDFNKEIKKNSNYLMADKIHLSLKGNEALNDILKDILIDQDNKEDE